MRRLTRQLRIQGVTRGRAVTRAGYSRKTAKEAGSRLMAKVALRQLVAWGVFVGRLALSDGAGPPIQAVDAFDQVAVRFLLGYVTRPQQSHTHAPISLPYLSLFSRAGRI